jgi:hypothetical protein
MLTQRTQGRTQSKPVVPGVYRHERGSTSEMGMFHQLTIEYQSRELISPPLGSYLGVRWTLLKSATSEASGLDTGRRAGLTFARNGEVEVGNS